MRYAVLVIALMAVAVTIVRYMKSDNKYEWLAVCASLLATTIWFLWARGGPADPWSALLLTVPLVGTLLVSLIKRIVRH